jgi:hypothetical protein
MLFIDKYKLQLFIVFIFNILFFCSCIDSKEDKKSDYADIMKSDVLTDEALNISWNLLTQGQQLADDGNSIDDIVKTFPEGTLVSTNENSILFFIDGSIPMIIELDKNGDNKNKGGGGYHSKPLNMQTSPLLSLNTKFLSTSFNESEGLVDVIASDKGDDERQQKKALILSPFIEEFGKNDDGLIAYEYLKKNRNYKDNITFIKDKFTLNDYLSFGEYDLVHLSTHGQVFCNRIKYFKEGKVEIVSGGDSNFCHTIISTNIKHGIKSKEINERLKKKVLKKYGGEFEGHIAFNTEAIYLTGTFFDSTYKDLEDKIWIFSACETGIRSDLYESIKRIHTNGHFFSWLYSVNSGDAYKAFNKFYENLISKGLDVEKAYDNIPIELKEDLPSTLPDTSKDTIETTTSLLHLQTDDPRHGIEVIDMLNPENKNLIEQNDFYPLVGDFDDGKDETLNLKVKLIGYTQAEFLEKQMRISLEVDDETVLSKISFLPDVGRDNITVEPLKNHEFGVLVAINDIAIPDVGKKEKITLKAILHLNDKYISIHKETVIILSYGIIATTERRGRKSKFTYDGKRKTGKYELGALPVVYYDDEGYKYINSNGSGWKKVNMRKMIGNNSNLDSKTRTLLNYPLAGYALIYKISDFEKIKEYKKTKIDCGFPAKCSEFSSTNGVHILFNPSGKLIQFKTPTQTINFKYGNYSVILPEAYIPKKVKELENVMSKIKPK